MGVSAVYYFFQLGFNGVDDQRGRGWDDAWFFLYEKVQGIVAEKAATQIVGSEGQHTLVCAFEFFDLDEAGI